jgi:hypothetical protein
VGTIDHAKGMLEIIGFHDGITVFARLIQITAE